MLTTHPAAKGTFPVYSVFAENLYSLVEALHPPCARFVLLVAADTAGIPATDLHDWAGRALECGATYVCCWGPGAERLHEAVDLAANDRETDESRADGVSVIMTTDHAQESLVEAAWFAVRAAYPVGIFESGTEAIILAAVGNREWYSELIQFLNDGAPTPDAT
jgi:hypothetical protein